ncbi:MAG: DUF192 domain-containing protein [Kastovskya adunca ATA6-11-RM4]|jgi:hypothetical protein|nr:DUF192 domain-containing protein [Kastovskya adunca ATA6-11-RM4]
MKRSRLTQNPAGLVASLPNPTSIAQNVRKGLRWTAFLEVLLCVVLLGCSTSASDSSSAQTPLKSGKTLPPPPSEVSQAPISSAQSLPITAQAKMGGKTIALEVARTLQQQSIGLMYRDSVADSRGMLFPFDPPRPVNFWMKNVKIPLDMVFLRDGEIKAIAADVPPCKAEPCKTYGPGQSVEIDQVIELRGGRAAELGLSVGDRVQVNFAPSTTPDTESPSS